MVNGKKGMEWPAVMMSTVFSAVLLVLGVMMIADVSNSVTLNGIKYTGTLDFYAVAERIMNSPDCTAWEEMYSGNSIVYQPHLGIIDIEKFNQDRIASCIKDRNFKVTLQQGSEKISVANVDSFAKFKVIWTDIFPVKVQKNHVLYDGQLEVTIA